MPRYVDLATEIAERISAERRAPGDAVESEHQLSREFNVSRGTVVKAMDLLERQGIVQRIQGRGTFVMGRPALQSTTQLVSFTQFVESTGRRAGHRVCTWANTVATDDNPMHSTFDAGTSLVDFSRVRLIDDVPVGVHRVVVPGDTAVLINLTDHLDGDAEWSLYRLLADAGVHPGWADETMTARLASDAEAEVLQVTTPSPLLTVTRHTFDMVGRPIESVEASYVPDRYVITAESVRGPVRQLRSGVTRANR